MASNRALKCVCLALAVALVPAASAKDSTPLIPAYVLEARTTVVMIDPDAGRSASDPNANQTAQKDVETALLKWGRLQAVLNPADADLVIVVRKGNGKVADVTVRDPRQNERPGSVTSTDGAISIGVQRGQPPRQTGIPSQEDGGGLHPQVETGSREDSFTVYEGHRDDPIGSNAPGWRYVHKNALHSHDVPAVDQFRKAIDAAAKQAAQQKP
jgi:hypothetical protein